MDPCRRSVLGAGLFSVALSFPGWPDVIGRAEAVQSGRVARIGMNEVDMVIAMTECVSELDDQFGGRHARPMAASFMVNTVASYLRADAPEEVRQAMLSAASDLLYLTGYMAVDEGLHGLAQRYYVKALELAGAAEDHLTYCTTLRGMSVQAVDLRHGAKAMELADVAAAASPKAGPRMRAFLSGQQAHAAAQTGDRTVPCGTSARRRLRWTAPSRAARRSDRMTRLRSTTTSVRFVTNSATVPALSKPCRSRTRCASASTAVHGYDTERLWLSGNWRSATSKRPAPPGTKLLTTTLWFSPAGPTSG